MFVHSVLGIYILEFSTYNIIIIRMPLSLNKTYAGTLKPTIAIANDNLYKNYPRYIVLCGLDTDIIFYIA